MKLNEAQGETDRYQVRYTMSFALVASTLHLLHRPRVLQVTQTSRFLRERLLRQCHVRPIQIPSVVQQPDDHDDVEINGNILRQQASIQTLHLLSAPASPSPSIALDASTAPPVLEPAPTSSSHTTGITLIDSTETACVALKALVDVSNQGKSVAWAVHHEIDEKTRVCTLTLSAFAGDDVDFGNGPFLVVKLEKDGDNMNCSRLEQQSKYLPQLKRYFELENAQNLFIWFDLNKSMNVLSSFEIQPKGFHRDVQTMFPMLPEFSDRYSPSKSNAPIKNLDTIAQLVFPSSSYPHHSMLGEYSLHKSSVQSEKEHKSVKSACSQAFLLNVTHEELCKKLEQTTLCQHTTPNEYSDDIRTALDAYDHFFRLVHESLNDVERNGIYIDTNKLQEQEKKIVNEKTQLEKQFLDWAVQTCPDARFMDPHKTGHLRHLLFAPCRNSVNDKENLEEIVKVKVSVKPEVMQKIETEEGNKKKRGRKRTRAVKKEIELKGMGLTPYTWLKSGWPSTSKTALAQLAQRGSPEISSGGHDQVFKNAINSLIQAGELKSKSNKMGKIISAVDNKLNKDDGVRDRLHYRHYFGMNDIGVERSGGDENIKYSNEIKKAVSASEGNQLVILEYKRLRLWALAQLSGCESLMERTMSEIDLTTNCAWRMYEGVSDMITNGELILSRDVKDAASIDNNSNINELKEKLPLTWDVVRKVDAAFRHGGGVGGNAQISAITGVKGKKVEELRRRWYGGHPRVEEWHAEWRERTLRDEIVSTMMGRMTPLALDGGGTDRQMRVRAEKALTKGMDWVLGGTAAEAVMASVTRMKMNEQLNGLGWRIVLVDGHIVVLEGPEFSADSAISLIGEDAKSPFPLLDSSLLVEKAVASSMHHT